MLKVEEEEKKLGQIEFLQSTLHDRVFDGTENQFDVFSIWFGKHATLKANRKKRKKKLY